MMRMAVIIVINVDDNPTLAGGRNRVLSVSTIVVWRIYSMLVVVFCLYFLMMVIRVVVVVVLVGRRNLTVGRCWFVVVFWRIV